MNDKYAIGIALLVISTVLLPFHLIFIWFFLSKKEYRRHMAFKIMASLGIIDCFHILSHFATGLMTVLASNINTVIERVWTLVLTSWVGMAGMIFILSLNRLVVLTSARLASRSERQIYSLCAVVWTTYLGVLALHMTNEGAINYRIRESSFSYALTDLNMLYAEVYESYWILICLSMSFLCYLVIFLWILLNKQFRPKHIKIAGREVKILVQAIIIFGYLTTLRATWHYGTSWYMKHVEVVNTLNILTSLVGGVNPVLYLCFNSGLRAQFFALFGLRQKNHTGKSCTVTVLGVHK
uniref:G_PROTEIN_RECEP_F1_2 domain-containing protein n=1 Tax=Steinernema glaseri TaxID=37863 RepID=A0A1I7ZB49_9BILA